MEKNKILFTFIIFVMIVMALSMCFIGYSMHQINKQLNNISYEISWLGNIKYAVESVRDAVSDIYRILR